MLIKFNSTDPNLEVIIKLLKLKYRTGAVSKAVKRSLYDFHHVELENEILRGQVEQLESDVKRLHDLLELCRNTKTGTKWRYLE